MRATHIRGHDRSEWVIRASEYDFVLSASKPLDARIYRFARPTFPRVSIHDGLELGILLKGRNEMYFEGAVFPGQAGDCWVVPMWEPHGWRITSSSVEQVTMTFLPEFLGDSTLGDVSWLSLFACSPSERPWVRKPETRKAMLALGRELRHEIEEKPPHWETAVRLAMLRVLFGLRRDWSPPSQSRQQSWATPPSLARIMPALALIHARSGLHGTLEAAAAACNLSPAQFSRIFRRTMGLPFGRFRQRSRLAFVADQLLTTPRSVQSIAEEAGFVDASHLYRAFAQRYGCTPGQYRESSGGVLPDSPPSAQSASTSRDPSARVED